jgi:hypothetical protein
MLGYSSTSSSGAAGHDPGNQERFLLPPLWSAGIYHAYGTATRAPTSKKDSDDRFLSCELIGPSMFRFLLLVAFRLSHRFSPHKTASRMARQACCSWQILGLGLPSAQLAFPSWLAFKGTANGRYAVCCTIVQQAYSLLARNALQLQGASGSRIRHCRNPSEQTALGLQRQAGDHSGGFMEEPGPVVGVCAMPRQCLKLFAAQRMKVILA